MKHRLEEEAKEKHISLLRVLFVHVCRSALSSLVYLRDFS